MSDKLNDLLVMFFETFGGGNKGSLEGYKIALEDYDYSRIEKSIKCLIKNWKPIYGAKRPTPAEIIEAMPPMEKDMSLTIEEDTSPVTSKEQAKRNIKKIKAMLKGTWMSSDNDIRSKERIDVYG